MPDPATRRLSREAFVGFVMALICLAAFVVITAAKMLTAPPGPILEASPIVLNGPYSEYCTTTDSFEVVCQVTIAALETNQVPLQWDSHIGDANSIAPSQGMLMPGESTGPNDGPYLGYLRALWAWDKRFPGFGHDTHGVENRDGTYYVQCLKKTETKGRAARK